MHAHYSQIPALASARSKMNGKFSSIKENVRSALDNLKLVEWKERVNKEIKDRQDAL